MHTALFAGDAHVVDITYTGERDCSRKRRTYNFDSLYVGPACWKAHSARKHTLRLREQRLLKCWDVATHAISAFSRNERHIGSRLEPKGNALLFAGPAQSLLSIKFALNAVEVTTALTMLADRWTESRGILPDALLACSIVGC